MATTHGADEPENKPARMRKPNAQSPSLPQPATVPDDADVDLPPGGTKSDLIKVDDPDATHRRVVDMTRLRFGIVIVFVAIAFVGVASVVQWLFQENLPDSNTLSNAIDWMKVIATTALGFVFGRATLDKNNKKDEH